MSGESIQIIINKISTIYTEQIWAVTIFAAMSGFIISKAKYLVDTLGYKVLKRGVIGTTILCSSFVFIRFIAFWKYEKILDDQLISSGLKPIINPVSQKIALFSGTVFYLIIIFVLCLITLKVLGRESKRNQWIEAISRTFGRKRKMIEEELSKLENVILKWVSYDFERVEDIKNSVSSDYGREVSATEIHISLLKLQSMGFVDSYYYSNQDNDYVKQKPVGEFPETEIYWYVSSAENEKH